MRMTDRQMRQLAMVGNTRNTIVAPRFGCSRDLRARYRPRHCSSSSKDDDGNDGNDDEDDDDYDDVRRGEKALSSSAFESLTEEEPKLTRVCGSRETLSPSPSGAGGGALLRPRASD